jgi:hypothetical protein
MLLFLLLLSAASLDAVSVNPMTSGFPPGKWREPCEPPGTILPVTGVHDTGLLAVSIDDVGGQEAWRRTFFWPDTTAIDHLYWNWLALGFSMGSVVDAWDMDWSTTPGGQLVILEPGPVADEEGLAEFADNAGRARVAQHSFAWDSQPDEDYVIIAYSVVNTSGSQEDSVYVSHRTDFDVLGDHSGMATDMSSFDNARALAYMWDTRSAWHAGVRLLDGRFCGYHTGFYTDDGWKYIIMSSPGAESTTPYPDDWCFWLSAGPYSLAPGDSFSVAFAFLMGESLEDLQANADRALAKWRQVSVAEARPAHLEFRVAATICRGTLMLPQASILKPQASSRLLDINGREVMSLSHGANDVSRLSPGVYFVREAQAQAQAQAVQKVIITR